MSLASGVSGRTTFSRRRIPGATVQPRSLPAGWARAIAAAIGGRPATSPDVPVDVQGTAFQWRVWKALTAIPAGETRTYAVMEEVKNSTRLRLP